MGKKAVSSFVPAQMIAVHDAAFNQIQISKQLNISSGCVQNAIKKYKRLGTYQVGQNKWSSWYLDNISFNCHSINLLLSF